MTQSNERENMKLFQEVLKEGERVGKEQAKVRESERVRERESKGTERDRKIAAKGVLKETKFRIQTAKEIEKKQRKINE